MLVTQWRGPYRRCRDTAIQGKRLVAALAAVAVAVVMTAPSTGAQTAGAVTPNQERSGEPRAENARGQTVTVSARPSAMDELERLEQALSISDLNVTGVYLPPGEELIVNVHRSGAVPAVVVGPPDADPDHPTPRRYDLQTGPNAITDPGGGVVYLELIGADGQATVTFGGGAVRMPTFELGRTTQQAFQAQLDAWTTSAYVELVSEHGIVTVTRDAALEYRDEDHAKLLTVLDEIIEVEGDVSGLDGAAATDEPNAALFHLVHRPDYDGVAYATHGHTAYATSYLDRLLTVEGLTRNGWGVYHELGHQHQQQAYKPADLTEVTVNIYALAVNAVFADRYGQQPRLHVPDETTGLTPWESAPPKIGQPGVDYLDSFDPYERLVMFRQLEMAFGDDFFPALHQLIRDEKPETEPSEDEKRWRMLVVYFSRTAGYDLTTFFDDWGVPMSEQARAEIADLDLPEPPDDPTQYQE